MYIVTLKDASSFGAYSIVSENGEVVVQIFEDYDDALRYTVLLEAEDFPELIVKEVDNDYITTMCENNNYKFVVISKDDIVIPPIFSETQ